MRERPRRPRRGRRSAWRLLAAWARRLAVIGVLAWLAGFAVFVFVAETAEAPDPLPRADGIVALTGGADRITAALDLLGAGNAPTLLISGAGRGTYLGDFTADDTTAATQDAAHITLGHNATTTEGNATEIAGWARPRHVRRLIVVTADYHMPRALLEISAALPGVTLYPMPVRPPAMERPFAISTLRLLALEYTKYLVVRIGLGPELAPFAEQEKW
jgi:uncharacterized SAM-binding protein YcdF (DUF218 family)